MVAAFDEVPKLKSVKELKDGVGPFEDENENDDDSVIKNLDAAVDEPVDGEDDEVPKPKPVKQVNMLVLDAQVDEVLNRLEDVW